VAPTRTTAPRSRGVAAGVDRDQIVAVTIAIVERAGVSAISMRSVAGELGVSPQALYNHVADKEDLFDAVTDTFFRQQVMHDLPSEPPVDRIRRLCLRLWDAGRRHPAIVSAIIDRLPVRPCPGPLQFSEALLEALNDAGVAGEPARTLYVALSTLTVGNAMLAAASDRGGGRESVARRLKSAIAMSDIVDGSPISFARLAGLIETDEGPLQPGTTTRELFITQLELLLCHLTRQGVTPS